MAKTKRVQKKRVSKRRYSRRKNTRKHSNKVYRNKNRRKTRRANRTKKRMMGGVIKTRDIHSESHYNHERNTST